MKSCVVKKICKDLCKKIINLENTECTICLNEIKIGTLLIPCNHYQLCMKCSTLLQECPLCRKNIENIVNYYKDDDCYRNLLSTDFHQQ